MSADPNSAPAPDPAAAAEASAQASDRYQFPQVKRRYKKESEAGDAPGAGPEPATSAPEVQLRKEIDALNARLLALAEQRTAAPPPSEAAEARNAKYFRLTRKASAPASAREPGAAPVEPAPPVLPLTERVVIGYHPPANTGWLLATIGILALVALAFYLGWLSGRPLTSGTTAAPVVPAWTEAEIAQLDRVFDTERSGNARGAYQDAMNLDKQLGGRLNLEGYACLLEARAGKVNDAEADLVRKVDVSAPPREVAALQECLGFVYARRRDFKSASESFSNAAAADPLDPLAFYYWGEALRRSGRLPEAVRKFREVLSRLSVGQPESDGLWQSAAFRMRLSQIELGNDADLKPVLDAQLARPVPSIYWLLTAAAYDLQHNDVPAALGVLQRIKVVSPPELLDALLNDYFLRGLAVHNTDAAAYFPELTPERRGRLSASGAVFIDP